jgi:hypothetical protein
VIADAEVVDARLGDASKHCVQLFRAAAGGLIVTAECLTRMLTIEKSALRVRRRQLVGDECAGLGYLSFRSVLGDDE